MIGSTEIKEVSEIMFLGVTLDAKLSWDAYVRSLGKEKIGKLYWMHKPNFNIST